MNQLDFRKLVDHHRRHLSEIAIDCLGCFHDGRVHDVITVGDHLERLHKFDRPGAAERLAAIGLQHLVAAGVVAVDRAGFHRLADSAAQIDPQQTKGAASDE